MSITSDDELRDRIAAELYRSGRLQFDGERYKAADELLTVVREAIAAELDAAADAECLSVPGAVEADQLRQRAARWRQT